MATLPDGAGAYAGVAPDALSADKEGGMKPHTPGPWRVKPVFISQTTCSALHFGEYRLELPQPVVNENATLPREIANANARLIAAAPEMLEALEAIYRELGNVSPALFAQITELTKDKLAAAIRKARGTE